MRTMILVLIVVSLYGCLEDPSCKNNIEWDTEFSITNADYTRVVEILRLNRIDISYGLTEPKYTYICRLQSPTKVVTVGSYHNRSLSDIGYQYALIVAAEKANYVDKVVSHTELKDYSKQLGPERTTPGIDPPESYLRYKICEAWFGTGLVYIKNLSPTSITVVAKSGEKDGMCLVEIRESIAPGETSRHNCKEQGAIEISDGNTLEYVDMKTAKKVQSIDSIYMGKGLLIKDYEAGNVIWNGYRGKYSSREMGWGD